MSLSIGQVIDGKYLIVRLIGKGGMGAVYAGEHVLIGRRVAIKVLHANIAQEHEAVTRFEREARAAGRIGNDHILDVLDVGSLPDGSRYMVCEFLDGETLASRLAAEKPMAPQAITPIALQLLEGLHAAHLAGVVHRDLKPANVFLLRQKAGMRDFVKIIDFGISKFQPLSAEQGMGLTLTGMIMGTPFYLSPEQARGLRDADRRSDVYAVGVILYEAVCARLPFQAEALQDLLFKIALHDPEPPHVVVPELDPAFSQIVTRAIARDPDARYQSADELRQALEAWRQRAAPHVRSASTPAPSAANLGGPETMAARAATPKGWGARSAVERPWLPSSRRSLLAIAVGIAAVGVFAASAVLLFGARGMPQDPADAAPAAEPLPPPRTSSGEPAVVPVPSSNPAVAVPTPPSGGAQPSARAAASSSLPSDSARRGATATSGSAAAGPTPASAGSARRGTTPPRATRTQASTARPPTVPQNSAAANLDPSSAPSSTSASSPGAPSTGSPTPSARPATQPRRPDFGY